MLHSLTDQPVLTAVRSALPGLLMLLLLAGCASAPSREMTAAEGEAAPQWPAGAVKDYQRALGLMDAGRDEEAATRLAALAKKYPDFSGPLMNLGLIAVRQGEMDQAANYFNLATTVCSNCAPAWNELGVLYREQGEFAAAEQAYLQAIASDPDYALAHYNLGVLYDLYQSRHATAVEHYERYVILAGTSGDTAQVDRWIADLRRRLGEPPRTAQIGDE